MKKKIKNQKFFAPVLILVAILAIGLFGCKKPYVPPVIPPTTKDTVKPVISLLDTANNSQTSITLKFGFTDNKGVTNANLSINTQNYDVLSLTTKSVTGLIANTSYTATLTVKDAAGNTANKSINFTTLANVPVYTAVINPSGSYDASTVAVDKNLSGRSVAKAFVLNVTTAGTVQVDVIGRLNSGGSPISHYWINAADNADLGVAASTLGSVVPKTAVAPTLGPGSFIMNLRAGINVIIFKTSPYVFDITAGVPIGFKITDANGNVYANSSYITDPSANVAAKIKVVNKWLNGVYINPTTPLNGNNWGDYNIIPQDENGNFDINEFPKISSVAVSTLYYDNTYPKLFFGPSALTPVGFQSDFKIMGTSFGSNIDINSIGTVFAGNLPGNNINYTNHIVSFIGPAVQTVKSAGNYAIVILKLNVYNSDNVIWGPSSVGFDPAKGGWKFVGNPEMEMWTGDTPSQRIY